MNIKMLVGSGSKIGRFTLPFLVAGIILNILFPGFFEAGGPPEILKTVSFVFLAAGLVCWGWTVALILTKIPRKELITTGPFTLVKHPLYTGVAFLVLPWAGFLFNTWLGLLIGIVVYIASRLYSPEEERILLKIFGEKWTDYCGKVVLPWL